jgi:hypothetical protein
MKRAVTSHDQVLGPQIDAVHPENAYPGKVDGPHCMPLGDHTSAAVLDKVVSNTMFAGTTWGRIHAVDTEEERLILHTPKGFSLTPVTMRSRWHNDPGCLHNSSHGLEGASIERTSTGHDVLVLRLIHKDIYWGQMDPSRDGIFVSEVAYACQANDAGAASCDGPLVLGSSHAELPRDFDPSVHRFYSLDSKGIAWTTRKRAVLGPAGDLRAE